MEKRWLTVRETSIYLRKHIKTVYSLCSKRLIPHSRVKGIGIRIDKKRLDEQLENSEEFKLINKAS